MINRSFELIILLLFALIPIFSQDDDIIEFNNRPIRDILIVLADLTGKNLILDETVKGNSSYYFSTNNMDQALNIFLKSNKLYISSLENAYNISKIKIDSDTEQKISIECVECNIGSVINKLAIFSDTTILFDDLPIEDITLNITGLKLQVILEIIIKKFVDYKIETNRDYLYIKREEKSVNIENDTSNIIKGITSSSDGKYSINLKKVRFSQVISELFNKAKIEYSIQGRNDNIIDSLIFKNRSFNELLNLILEGGSCDYVLSDSIYYIFDITKAEIANNHIKTEVIKLKNLTVSELLKLIPGSFMSNNVIKTDESSNSVIVYGSTIKTSPIIEFIKMIDIDKNLKPRWIKTHFISADLLKTLLLKTYAQSSIINVDEKSFLILLTDDDYKGVLKLKGTIDLPPNRHMITLKYLKSDELLENLPKSIDANFIIETENPSKILFYGENELYNTFLQALEKIDRPVPQIKYKVLVLQNTIGDNSHFNFGVNSHSENNGDISLPDDEWSSYSGALSGLMSLNFNVFSAFGALFSLELNASIQENKTKVLVDTTLQGLSGKEVSFRNTTTSRFYQTTTDADGETETGAAQEVPWGIILNIEGWSSGDGMVTVNIESTISDETTVSGESSGIPSTSEKIVKTEVRTREGVPVVIGGLLSSKKESSQSKTPILGYIPLLGRLFTDNTELETQSEFIIYLLPYIEDDYSVNIDKKLERAYRELVKS